MRPRFINNLNPLKTVITKYNFIENVMMLPKRCNEPKKNNGFRT